MFIRAFDVKNYAGGDKTPLYVEPAAISAEAPLHATWTRNCDRLLGREEPTTFPADDYVGNLIVWDKTTVQDMTRAIEGVTNKTWAHALCRTRDFSEYLLYGHFVRNSQRHLPHHEIITESLANAYWGYVPLDSPALTAMVNSTPDSKVALCIESFSRTPVSIIRDAVGLRRRPAEARHRVLTRCAAPRNDLTRGCTSDEAPKRSQTPSPRSSLKV